MRRFDPCFSWDGYAREGYADMSEDSEGDYVLYSEAHAEIERLKEIASDLRDLLADLQRLDDEC